jgi:hypothetical protein
LASRAACRRAVDALVAAVALRWIGVLFRDRGVAFADFDFFDPALVGFAALDDRDTGRAAARRSARNAAPVARAARARLELTLASAFSKISAFDALRRGAAPTTPRARATSTCAATSRRCSCTNLSRARRTRACSPMRESSSMARRNSGRVSASSACSFCVNDCGVARATSRHLRSRRIGSWR